MSSLKRLFWDGRTRRLRAGWRLVLQTALLVACTLATGLVLTLLALPFGVAPGSPGPETPPGTARLLSALAGMGGVAASMAAAARYLDRRPFAGFGFHLSRRWGADLAFGLALGPALMGSIFLIGWGLGWIEVTGVLVPAERGGSFALPFAGALVTFVCVGIYEEMVARGYHLLNVAEGLAGFVGPQAALAVGCGASAAVFGALHWGNPNATLRSTACLVGAGLLFGLAYVVTGELGLPIGLHISWNFAQGNVFGFPVSGTDAGAALLGTRSTGPEWWTGGAFGPEAGVSGVLALGVAALAILAWTRFRHGDARPRLALARYDPPGTAAERVAEAESA
ncbi:MAG: CPBP family intramembrane metalloprotease domain-containing protein [Bacteroidetes bacterium QS_9_68_14]|nr:MAG: CPBP family intramembrane metalloprotease domain-containing protein [Bacteroidetes bacterium QS_9_68_14]